MFQKAFTAGGAEIPSFSQNESNMLPEIGDILYFLKTVIVDTLGFPAAARAGLFSGERFNVNLQKRICMNYFSD